MTEDRPVRAGDAGAGDARVIMPDADVPELIEQHAAPYREVPWAVIREMFQNAADALCDDTPRFIEYAILSKQQESSPPRYHIVIRDSGAGMMITITSSRNSLVSVLPNPNPVRNAPWVRMR